MRSAIRFLVLAVGLVSVPSTATAGLITLGPAVWSNVGVPDSDGTPYWDQQSDDCKAPANCNVAQVILGADGGLYMQPFAPGDGVLQYLHDGSNNPVSFLFDTSVTPWNWGYFNTGLDQGTPGQLGTGQITYSILAEDDPDLQHLVPFYAQSDLNPQQFALFRQVGPQGIRYFIGFEDRGDAGADYDYNDSIVSFFETRTAPEPTTLTLLGSAVIGIGVRRMRRRS